MINLITQAHIDSVCQELDLFESDYRRALSSGEEAESRLHPRTVRETIVPGNELRADTGNRYLSALQRIGIKNPKDPRYWPKDKKAVQECLPSLISHQDLVEPGFQNALFKNMSGAFNVYRRHSGENALIKEKLIVLKKFNINVICYFINYTGEIYRGHVYKVSNIIYIYLFRPDDEFKFGSRTMFVDGPKTGKVTLAEGAMIRITNSVGIASSQTQ